MDIDLLVLPDLLTQAERMSVGFVSPKWNSVYAERQTRHWSGASWKSPMPCRRHTLASMRIRVWLLAGVGVILLVGRHPADHAAIGDPAAGKNKAASTGHSRGSDP